MAVCWPKLTCGLLPLLLLRCKLLLCGQLDSNSGLCLRLDLVRIPIPIAVLELNFDTGVV